MDLRNALIAGLGLFSASWAGPGPAGAPRISLAAQAGQERLPRAPERIPALNKLATQQEIAEWFETADYNDNDWISYRESHRSLGFDRTRFRIYDVDRDGRLVLSEFKEFYQDSIRNGHGFEPPALGSEAATEVRRQPGIGDRVEESEAPVRLGAE